MEIETIEDQEKIINAKDKKLVIDNFTANAQHSQYLKRCIDAAAYEALGELQPTKNDGNHINGIQKLNSK